MKYYNILNFKKEPFSNSPEPEFLFQLPQYSDCLQKLELAVRLRRGMNVVIGDIGTGKTTLCRKLIQNLSSDSSDIETHLLLDPAVGSGVEFLRTVALMLGIDHAGDDTNSEWRLKETIKNYLFRKGVDEKKIIVLIIDEGQKIPEQCLEILREFLNYETNTYKLLQIVIFAQPEFKLLLERKPNLADRVNLTCYLRPLRFRPMTAMIRHRLNVARNFEEGQPILNFWGLAAIYLSTGGYPRKIVFLCHRVVLKMIIREKSKAGWFLVRACIKENDQPMIRKIRWASAVLVLVITAGLAAGAVKLHMMDSGRSEQILAESLPPAVVDNAVEEETVVQDAVPPEGKEMQVREINMPDYIGRIPMTKRRTIWWTVHNVYGDTGQHIIKSVLATNPHLVDEDVVQVGTMITLPAVPAEADPISRDDVLVALESGQDLEIMYNIFQNSSERQKLPSLAFFSFWSQAKGFEFAVIMDRKFKDSVSAEETINKLPVSLAGRAKILSQWGEDTVFFNRRPLQY